MTDRERLAELIKSAKAAMRGKEFTCNLEREYFTTEYLIAHGVTVKEPQKPLTVEELFPLPDVVYVECSYFAEVYAALPERYDKQTIDLMMRDECCRFLLKGYGKTWRCWAERPTEEEREAAEWRN